MRVQARGILRERFLARMDDACHILTPTTTTNEWGEDVEGDPTVGALTSCSFVPMGSNERLSRMFGTLDIQAVAYLPLGTTVTSRSRLRLVSRNGETLATPEEYDVNGQPAVLDTAVMVKLKSTTL